MAAPNAGIGSRLDTLPPVSYLSGMETYYTIECSGGFVFRVFTLKNATIGVDGLRAAGFEAIIVGYLY